MLYQSLEIEEHQFRLGWILVRGLVAQLAQQLPLLGTGQHT